MTRYLLDYQGCPKVQNCGGCKSQRTQAHLRAAHELIQNLKHRMRSQAHPLVAHERVGACASGGVTQAQQGVVAASGNEAVGGGYVGHGHGRNFGRQAEAAHHLHPASHSHRIKGPHGCTVAGRPKLHTTSIL